MFYELLASAKNAAATNSNTIPEWLILVTSTLLGVICGMVATVLIDLLRERRRKKYFCRAVSSELKQLLALSLTDMIHLDAEKGEEKITLLYESQKKYDLKNEVFRNVDIDIDILFGDAGEAVAMLKRLKAQRKQTGYMMSCRKMNCNFINNNFEIIGLLEKDKASRIINLISRIESRNHIVDEINADCSRLLDNPNSANINKHNYYSSCHHLSDSAVNLTKVITELIDLLD